MTKEIPQHLMDEAEAHGTPTDDMPEVGEEWFKKAKRKKLEPKSRMWPTKGLPKDHQVRALHEANEKPGHCYWMDPGAGKTFVCIAEAGDLYEQDKIDGVMIFAPNGPHEQWIDEQFPMWASYRWRGIHNRNTPTQIKKFFDQERPGLSVMAINFDALRTKNGEKMISDFYKKHPRVYLVIDESQKIKSPRAQRSKEALRWALQSAYRRLLSGTPVLKGLEDLWTQYEACEPGLAWPHEPVALRKNGKTLNTYGYLGYRTHFCKLAPVPGNPRAQRIVGYRNEPELLERTREHATRIMADEFMKSEKPDFITVRTPMGADQKRQYTLMKDHLLALIDSGAITASNALTQLQKLQQIASGFLYTDEDGTAEWLSDSKIDAAKDLVEQLDEPVIVFAPHRALMLRIYEELPGSTLYQGRADLEHWDKVLIGNQASGLGVGLNLQRAAATIYMSNSFSSEARWQSLKRTDRIGQKRQVRYWDLITPGTVDEKVMQALQDKQDVSRRTIDELRSML